MKTYAILLWMFSFVYSDIKSQEHSNDVFDKGKAEKIFTSILAKQDVLIGIFEVPKIEDKPTALKSGILPEVQSNYLEVVRSFKLIKLRLISSLKGDFDNVIFLKR